MLWFIIFIGQLWNITILWATCHSSQAKSRLHTYCMRLSMHFTLRHSVTVNTISLIIPAEHSLDHNPQKRINRMNEHSPLSTANAEFLKSHWQINQMKILLFVWECFLPTPAHLILYIEKVSIQHHFNSADSIHWLINRRCNKKRCQSRGHKREMYENSSCYKRRFLCFGASKYLRASAGSYWFRPHYLLWWINKLSESQLIWKIKYHTH